MTQGDLIPYKRLPEWTAETLPAGFRKQHNTKEGTWARLIILEGELDFFALDADGEVQAITRLTANAPTPFVQPQAWHRVAPASSDLLCYLEFYCEPDRYYEKKYGLTAPHSEVQEVMRHIQGGDALDLGCGRGRNSIYMHHAGMRVTAVDHSETAIAKLREIIAAEASCRGIETALYDISTAAIERDYDLIVSTVVLQFIPRAAIPAVIANMQERTRPGGLNLIVAPMSTSDHPCPIDWPFTFGENELADFYASWTTVRYNEEMGTFHRKDEHGNFYRARFATLIARR